MHLKGQAFLKTLLELSKRPAELLHFLPHKLASEIQKLPKSAPFSPSVLSFDWSRSIHYSWFINPIKSYPKEIQPLFVAALSDSQAKAIKGTLALEAKKISPFLRSFFLHILLTDLQESDLLEEHFLPENPINCLLHLSRKQLLHIVDFLGLYDLAADMRQIIDKELLKKIENALSEHQRHFLHYCGRQPIRWMPPKLLLSTWDGSSKQLNHWLHHRGLIRLAKALVMEHASFKWHLLHRLDTGRARVIQKEFYQKQASMLVSHFKNQLLHITKKFETSSNTGTGS